MNHKRMHCSDGVRMKAQINRKNPDGTVVTVTDELPSWPQPSGIFEDGTTFHPTVFLRAVSRLYDQMVAQRSTGGEYAMEYLAFAEMLHKRTIVVPINDADDASALGRHSRALYDDDARSLEPLTATEGSPSSRSSSAAPGDQQVLFRLFEGLALGPCPSQLLVTYKGARYLSVTPLLEHSLPAEEEEEEED